MHLPNDYEVLLASGLLERLRSPHDSLFVWEAEFTVVPEEFERLDDQTIEIYPFATTGGGDLIGYVVSDLPNSDIFEFFEDSYEAEPIAQNIGQLLFRRAVAFAGNSEISDPEWPEDQARRYLMDTAEVFHEFLTPEMALELERISRAEPVQKNDFRTLISSSESDTIIDKFVSVTAHEIEWRGEIDE